jgi:hypothetical protein
MAVYASALARMCRGINSDSANTMMLTAGDLVTQYDAIIIGTGQAGPSLARHEGSGRWASAMAVVLSPTPPTMIRRSLLPICLMAETAARPVGSWPTPVSPIRRWGVSA